MGAGRPVPSEYRRARGAYSVLVLRGTAFGKRHAGYSPRTGTYHQRYVLPLQNNAGLPGAAQGRLGYTRTARRIRRGEETRYNQGGYRQENQRGRLQRRMPAGGNEIYQGVDEPHQADGLLGGSGAPVYHLRQQVYRNALVPAQAVIYQGIPLQGLHHPALLAYGRYGTQFARAQPARLLPRYKRHHLYRQVQVSRKSKVERRKPN